MRNPGHRVTSEPTTVSLVTRKGRTERKFSSGSPDHTEGGTSRNLVCVCPARLRAAPEEWRKTFPGRVFGSLSLDPLVFQGPESFRFVDVGMGVVVSTGVSTGKETSPSLTQDGGGLDPHPWDRVRTSARKMGAGPVPPGAPLLSLRLRRKVIEEETRRHSPFSREW